MSGKGKAAIPKPGQAKLSSSAGPEGSKEESGFNPEEVIGAVDYDNVLHGNPNPSGPTEVNEVELNIKSKGKAKVTRILKGKLGDFIPVNKLRNPDMANRDAYQVFFQTEDGRQFKETFTASVATNSKLRRFIAKYGKLAVGTEVEYAEDSRGFPRISL